MIVIAKHTNQLCNRLFSYLPVISYALEAGKPFHFLFQYRGYEGLFPNLREGGIKSYWATRSIDGGALPKAFYAIVRALDKVVHLVLKPGEAIPLLEPVGVLFNPKWREVRYDAAYVEKHREAITRLFAPSAEVLEAVRRKVCDGSRVTVGVHIRRGDYASFKGGRYFYDLDVYDRLMAEAESKLGKVGRVRFLGCSNDVVDASSFAGHDVFFMDGGVMEDLYGLAHCQYIIGPPSTFSQWASFWGRVPLWQITRADASLRVEDFWVCCSLRPA